jgi:hypothetical protein
MAGLSCQRRGQADRFFMQYGGRDMLRKFLFETKLGEKALEALEKRAGLSVVDSDWLGRQLSGTPQNPNANSNQETSIRKRK